MSDTKQALGMCEALHGDIPHVHITEGLNPCVNWEAEIPASDMPLEVVFEKDCLVVRIGVGTLAWAANHMDDWNPYDMSKGDFVQRWMVTDPTEFAKDVKRAMLDEKEDGSHPLSDFLDAMANAAADDGSLGIDECKTGKSVWDSEREVQP